MARLAWDVILFFCYSHIVAAYQCRIGTNLRANKGSFKIYCKGPEVSDVGVVLVAGGSGKRMNSPTPKQFLKLKGENSLVRSLQIFLGFQREVTSIVVVLDKKYRDDMREGCWGDQRIMWADPGTERQDSVYNGLLKLPSHCKIVCIHDAARPLVTEQEVLDCLHDGDTYGAAVLAVPVKATLKESQDGKFVTKTLDRSTLWEIQTPQVARRELLLAGFDKIRRDGLCVTDDVSVIEALNLPVKITRGQYTNIKITTPEDLTLAEEILRRREGS